jgi:antitoxin FitA
MYYGVISMPVNVSIKNVPDELMEALRKRAKRHHRSLHGELMVILEEAAGPAALTLNDAEDRFISMKLTTGDESAAWIRELRNAR